MLGAFHEIPKCRYRPIDFLTEAMLAGMVPLLQRALGYACLAALPWVALELAGWTAEWMTLAGAMTAGVSGSIPLLVGLRRIGRRAMREYRAYAAYEDRLSL